MAHEQHSASLRVGSRGRVVIPAEIRRQLEIVPGETLTAHIESNRLIIERGDQVLERLRGELREATPKNRSMVDELITERRVEAEREGAGVAVMLRLG